MIDGKGHASCMTLLSSSRLLNNQIIVFFEVVSGRVKPKLFSGTAVLQCLGFPKKNLGAKRCHASNTAEIWVLAVSQAVPAKT